MKSIKKIIIVILVMVGISGCCTTTSWDEEWDKANHRIYIVTSDSSKYIILEDKESGEIIKYHIHE